MRYRLFSSPLASAALLPIVLLLAACGRSGDDIGNRTGDEPANGVQGPFPADVTGPEPHVTTPPAGGQADGTVNGAMAGKVPAALRGRWGGADAQCGDGADPLNLRVTPDSLIFHESVGTVTAVAPADDGGLWVDADFTGEGESWTRRLLLRASADGRRLTITNDGAAVARRRCPAG
ncbi:MAG: hypothetical protein AB7E60_04375 [Sphingobium sp.]